MHSTVKCSHHALYSWDAGDCSKLIMYTVVRCQDETVVPVIAARLMWRCGMCNGHSIHVILLLGCAGHAVRASPVRERCLPPTARLMQRFKQSQGCTFTCCREAPLGHWPACWLECREKQTGAQCNVVDCKEPSRVPVIATAHISTCAQCIMGYGSPLYVCAQEVSTAVVHRTSGCCNRQTSDA